MWLISSRYIGWRICRMILLVLLIVGVIQLVMGYITQMRNVGEGHYTAFLALVYVLKTLPIQLYQLLSVAVFLGTILSLGAMVQQNELVVLRASGMSLYRLLRVALQSVMVLVVVFTLCCEFFAPSLYSQAVKTRKSALNNNSTGVQNYWLRKHGDFYLISGMPSLHDMSGVVSFRASIAGDDARMLYAANAHGKDGSWTAAAMTGDLLANDQVHLIKQHDVALPFHLDPLGMQIARREVRQQSVLGLRRAIAQRFAEGQPAGRFRVTYWQRILQPVAIMVLVLLAVPLVFTQMRRSSQAGRWLLGLGIGFLFYMFNQLLAPIGVVMAWSPMYLVLGPIIMFFILGLWLLRRVSN